MSRVQLVLSARDIGVIEEALQDSNWEEAGKRIKQAIKLLPQEPDFYLIQARLALALIAWFGFGLGQLQVRCLTTGHHRCARHRVMRPGRRHPQRQQHQHFYQQHHTLKNTHG